MHKIWKERCKNNLVRFQKTLPMPVFGPENKCMNIKYKEILNITSKTLFRNDTEKTFIYLLVNG